MGLGTSFHRGALIAVAFCIAGCTTGSGGYRETDEPVQGAGASARKLSDTAPSAREMETSLDSEAHRALPPVSRNGSGASASPKIRKPASPIIDEAVTLKTKDVYGANFPGMGEVAPSTANASNAQQREAERRAVERRVEEAEARLAQVEQRLSEAPKTPSGMDERLARLESQAAEAPSVSEERVRALEAKLAAIEGREPQVIQTTPETVDLRLKELEERYEGLRSQDPAAAAAAMESRLAEMETKLAAVEGRPPQIVAPASGDIDARFSEVESRLAALQVPAPDADTEYLQTKVRELEAKLAALENRAPQVIETTADTAGPQLAELEAEIAALRARNPDAAYAAMDQRIREMEARLAASEGRPPQIIETTPDNIDARFAEIETQLAERQAPGPAVDSSYTQAQIRELEAKIAALEGRAPVRVETVPAEADARLRELELRLAELQARPEPAAPIDPDVVASIEARYRELDRRVDELRDAPVQPAVNEDYQILNARYAQLEDEIAQLRSGQVPAADPALITEGVDARFDAVEARLDQLRLGMASDAESSGLLDRLYLGGAASGGAYSIGAGDLLEFESYNDTNLSRELTVRYDGQISLPLIPDINVSRLTREAAEDLVREAYRRVFRDPQISLLVRETGSKTYTVVGDIEAPGVYPYDRALRLIDAVSLAGGLRRRNSSSSVGGFVGITGQLTKCFVIRSTPDGRDVIQYDLRGLGDPGLHAADAPVLPGDLLYVPEGVNLVYLLGESRNPVIVELTEGMTLLQMLALSGGFNSSTARLRSVILLRQSSDAEVDVMNLNVREMLNTGKDIRLNPGDILYVPRKNLIRLQEFVSRITGSITPVFQMWTSAVDAYYANDIARALTEEPGENNTLRVLSQIEQFGTSTQNITDLFGAP